MTQILNLKEAAQNNSNENQEFLASLLNAFKNNFGEEIYSKWLANLEIFSRSSSELILSASSKFMRDWIIREYVENKKTALNIEKIAKEIDSKIKKVSVISLEKAVITPRVTISTNNSANITENKVISLSKHDNVFAFGSELNPKYTFANFVTTKYNKFAVAMAKIAAGVTDGQANLFDEAIPLYVHGGIGMGKTHLAQAIAWQIKAENKNKKVVYLTAEKFMYHFVQAVRNNESMDFKQKFRSIDVLIIDDVQFIAKKQGTQEEFMHTFNNLVESNKQVVLVCDRSPADLEAIDEKLKSRISGGMVINFKNPDFADRYEILKTKAALCGEAIDEKILEHLASKITSSVRDIDGALRKLMANKIFAGEEISLQAAKNIALEYSKASLNNIITIEKIQKAVAEHYEIKVSSLTSSTRERSIARPRQIAMYLAKQLTSDSLPKIGKALGNKNHATVIYAIKTVMQMMESDALFSREVKEIQDKIQK